MKISYIKEWVDTEEIDDDILSDNDEVIVNTISNSAKLAYFNHYKEELIIPIIDKVISNPGDIFVNAVRLPYNIIETVQTYIEAAYEEGTDFASDEDYEEDLDYEYYEKYYDIDYDANKQILYVNLYGLITGRSFHSTNYLNPTAFYSLYVGLDRFNELSKRIKKALLKNKDICKLLKDENSIKVLFDRKTEMYRKDFYAISKKHNDVVPLVYNITEIGLKLYSVSLSDKFDTSHNRMDCVKLNDFIDLLTNMDKVELGTILNEKNIRLNDLSKINIDFGMTDDFNNLNNETHETLYKTLTTKFLNYFYDNYNIETLHLQFIENTGEIASKDVKEIVKSFLKNNNFINKYLNDFAKKYKLRYNYMYKTTYNDRLVVNLVYQ